MLEPQLTSKHERGQVKPHYPPPDVLVRAERLDVHRQDCDQNCVETGRKQIPEAVFDTLQALTALHQVDEYSDSKKDEQHRERLCSSPS